MKKLLFLFVLLFSLLLQKKYTIPKTLKNYLPLKGQLITVLMKMIKKALLEALILLMEQNAITINFQISKRILNESESWYKMEIKKRIVLHKENERNFNPLL
jgi:hypothetical protein